MTILLYKDGRLVIDDGNPIEGVSLEGLVACVTDPQNGDTLKFDGKQWVAGAAASGLPAVSGDDNGKVLTVVEGEWAPAAAGGGGGGGALMVEISDDGNEYIADKTGQEIVDAVASGASVIFHFPDDDYTSNQYGYILDIRINTAGGVPIAVVLSLYYGGQTMEMSAEGLNAYPTYYYNG